MCEANASVPQDATMPTLMLRAKHSGKPASGTCETGLVSFIAAIMMGLEGGREELCSDASLLMTL